jgi:dihydroorotase
MLFRTALCALALVLPSLNEAQVVYQVRSPDDFHVHFRQGTMLKNVVNHTASVFKRAMVMPNTEPPIRNGEDVARYYLEILDAIDPQYQGFEPLMTFKITPATTVEDVQSVADLVIAGKLYPDGVTTNSQGGVTDFYALYPVFAAMQEYGIVLSLHGEKPGAFCLDREEKFLATLTQIVQDFPDLKIVLEHATTKAAVTLVQQLPDNVAATITLHHLELTLDDVVGTMNQPHHFCKPIPKRYEDRDALLKAAFSGNPKFFFGSDSAPHLKERKECSEGCAGVFSAPVAMTSLIALFKQHGHLERLEDFVSTFGANFYGLDVNEEQIQFIQEEWQVPAIYAGVVPYKAGKTLSWKILP